MENMIPCPIQDQEVFQRVWQRVMAGRSEESSLIRPNPSVGSGDLSCGCLAALLAQEGEGLPPVCRPEEPAPPAEQEPPELPAEEPMPGPEAPPQERPCAPAEGGAARWGSDLPQLWEEPQPADDRTARLRGHVMDALEGWKFYRHLARRARGADARMLNSLAGELHRHARKLSAAYFLLTGLRYWPTETLSAPAIPSYWGALRARHQAEQRQESAFRLAADDWEDQELLAMYGELADACQNRCRQLRSLLEQGM